MGVQIHPFIGNDQGAAGQVYGTWPASGEIDIMESVNALAKLYGTAHYSNGQAGAQVGYTLLILLDRWAADPANQGSMHMYRPFGRGMALAI